MIVKDHSQWPNIMIIIYLYIFLFCLCSITTTSTSKRPVFNSFAYKFLFSVSVSVCFFFFFSLTFFRMIHATHNNNSMNELDVELKIICIRHMMHGLWWMYCVYPKHTPDCQINSLYKIYTETIFNGPFFFLLNRTSHRAKYSW